MQSIIDGTVYYTKDGDDYIAIPEGTVFDLAQTYYIQTGSIQTLEQYFCHLKDLLDLPNGYKYIMLPLDEPPLTIDANKRVINVPSEFKASGLSVEGDELAETLFFKIDRYFDAMDLSSCEIFVQWNLPNGQTWVTVIYMIDIESEPGKLIFACPLTSEITQISGSVEFSVRFIKRSGGDAISYSFNTLPARATIGAGLKIGSDVQYVQGQQIMDLFGVAIENSDIASGEPAPAPVFTELLGNDDDINSIDKIYLTGENNTLTVKAETSPVGNITYEWYHTVSVDGWASKIKDNDTTGEFTITTQNDLVDIEDADYVNKTATGIYQVRAINRLNNKTAKAWSDKVELPAPLKPELVELKDGVIKSGSTTLKINETEGTHQENATYVYAWTRNMPGEIGYVKAENVTEENFDDAVHYVLIDEEYLVAEVFVEGTEYYNAVQEQPFANTQEISITAPGYYKVYVSASQNGDIAKSASNSVRITNTPTPIEFIDEYKKEATNKECNINAGVTAIDLTEAFEDFGIINEFTSDEMTYNWYIDADGLGVLDASGKIIDNAIDITYDKTAPVITGLESLGADVKLRCVATNKLNGEEVHTESVLFTVIAKVVS